MLIFVENKSFVLTLSLREDVIDKQYKPHDMKNMKVKNWRIRVAWLMSLCLLIGHGMAVADDFTRGIGQYPGRPNEFVGPRMVQDNAYRNLALQRAAYASSSLDYNLTAQLVTDGIVTDRKPAWLDVKIDGKPLTLRDKEKTIDGNIHSGNYLFGPKTSIEYLWHNMRIDVDTLRLYCEMAYHPQVVDGLYLIRVMGTKDGRRWQKIGGMSGMGMPGFDTKQTVSSDPNKQEDPVRLPLRLMRSTIRLDSPGQYVGLRLEFEMKGCAYWRIFEFDKGSADSFQRTSTRESIDWRAQGQPQWLPAERFVSALAFSPKDLHPWVYVDLGKEVQAEKVVLRWLNRPRSGVVECSEDGKSWTTVTALPSTRRLTDELKCQRRCRYVRVMMDNTGNGQPLMLTEMEVWGRGGVVPRQRIDTTADIVNWELRREGDSRWIPATVPGTVLTSYRNIGSIPDNCVANNMRQISESFFMSDFHYRAVVRGSRLAPGKHVYLNFDGVNWKAIVWLNGHRLGQIDGAFHRARFDVSTLLRAGDNLLEVKVLRNSHFGAVKVKNEESTDLNGGVLGADNPTFHASIGWDWITSVPGREVGIYNDVYLSSDDGVSLSDPVVTTVLSRDKVQTATMTPRVRVTNNSDQARQVVLKGWIGALRFAQTVELAAHQEKEVTFSPDHFAQLKNQQMRLWWPNGYGDAYLYDAGFAICETGYHDESTRLTFKAGIREVSYRDMDTALKIYVNGKRVTPLGGNWGFPEINLNYRGREYDAAVRYHRDMHFNMIRNWVGQIPDEEFYEACDKYGIMVWQDFWLANPWDGPDPVDEAMFLANSADYISRVRRYPCVTIYVGRNEGFPPQTIDNALRQQIARLHPQLGFISNSADQGVSGHGAYRLMPTEYYFKEQTRLLHSERGLPNVPSIQSLRRMLQSDALWPIGLGWAQHDFTMGGAQRASSLVKLLESRFGQPKSAEQFSQWAQWLCYDGYRAMYEGCQQYRMGLLNWMSHSCWPSMVWCTYDYYLEPTAAYFGAKKACEPLHVQFNPVSRQVQVVNMGTGRHHALNVKAQILNIEGKVVSEQTDIVSVDEDTTANVLTLREPADALYFVRLSLVENNVELSQNCYVQGRTDADWQLLRTLPMAQVAIDARFEPSCRKDGDGTNACSNHLDGSDTDADCCGNDDEMIGCVTLRNTSSTPALMIRLNLVGADGEQILPVLYSDNYFHLMPGEQKVVHVSYRKEDGRGVKPHVEISSFK